MNGRNNLLKKGKNRKVELLKNTLIIFLGKVSTQFISFFLLPIYTKYLPTDEYGTIDLLLTYITLLVPVISIEIEMGTFRFLVDFRNDEKKESQIIYNSLFLLLKIIYIFFSLSLLLIITTYKQKYALIVLFCITIMMLSNLMLQIARGLGKNIDYSIASFIIGISNIFSNIILIVFLRKTAICILISALISNIIGLFYLIVRINLFKHLKNGKKDTKLQRDLIKFSIPLVPNTISWWLINASDRTIVSFILGLSANGIYAISTKFSSIISSFLNIFNLSWTESASLHINDKDRDDFFSSINDSILRIFSAVCIGIIAFMPLVFELLIDSTYKEAYKYIPINIIATFFSCMVSVYSSIYVAKKMTKQVAYTSIMSAIINIVVDLILIRYIGLFAASISTAIAYLSMTIYRGIDLRKYVSIKYDIKNIVIIVISFTITLLLYYQYKDVSNYINIGFCLLYALYMNWNLIANFLKKILKTNQNKEKLNKNLESGD